ncbi:TPA: hypothetical protein ACGEC4_004918, partial [Klebsiella pneumoniae]
WCYEFFSQVVDNGIKIEVQSRQSNIGDRIKHPCYIFNLTFVIYLNYTLQEDIEALPSMFFLPEHHLYGRI